MASPISSFPLGEASGSSFVMYCLHKPRLIWTDTPLHRIAASSSAVFRKSSATTSLYYLWTAHHLERFIAIAADKATTMGHIKRGELEKAEVLIPSEKDYKEISSLMNPLFNLIVANRIEARKLAELRDELLPKLMSGEIDVSEVSV